MNREDVLSVELGGIKLKNPVMPAAGCFGYGIEFSRIIDISKLGAIVIKAITKNSKLGNPTPRIVETACGTLNSIGLQNCGLEEVKKIINEFENFNVPLIVNIAGESIEDYVLLAKEFSKLNKVKILEINISCPNVKCGGTIFGKDPTVAAEITRAIKKVSSKPVFVKLSPNVSDIVEIAKSVEDAGADGLTMINTLIGMKLNYEDGRPVLANGIGGLSGPAIKPIAISMIYQVSQVVKIPIIGVGGINKAEDVIDFISAGASAVAVGIANFIDPKICIKIINNLEGELKKLGVKKITDLRGRSWKNKLDSIKN